MASNRSYNVQYKRRRSGHTDYHLRRKLLESGKVRLVVRKSLQHISVQLISYHQEGDRVLAFSHSKELVEYGWKGPTSNLPSAYLTAYLCGLKAKKKGVKDFIADFGLYMVSKDSRLFASLKGALDAGLKGPHREGILPSEDVVGGKRISDYATLLQKENPERYKKQFGYYIKNNIKVEDMRSLVSETKKQMEIRWH